MIIFFDIGKSSPYAFGQLKHLPELLLDIVMGIDLVSGFKTNKTPLVKCIQDFILLLNVSRIDQKTDLPGGENLFHDLSRIVLPMIFNELICFDIMLLHLGLRVA